jgi:hypothetical protein
MVGFRYANCYAQFIATTTKPACQTLDQECADTFVLASSRRMGQSFENPPPVIQYFSPIL